MPAPARPSVASGAGLKADGGSLSMTMSEKSLRFLALALTAVGCATRPPPGQSAVPPSSPPAASSPIAPSAKAPQAEPEAKPPGGTSCGPLDCRAFDSEQEAFAAVLANDPLVIGIGEAHAQKGTEHVPSSTKRFTEQLLPGLSGKASFLLVELMLPNDKCKKETKQVEKQQKPVTKPQAESNQNEYLVLGKRAKELGIVPDLLRPSCEDLTAITQAGAGDISVMLETIARLTSQVVGAELDRNAKAGKSLAVIAYGGALHNDVSPREGREKWSYGPTLRERTQQRYVELDLIVPEYIKDSESWTSLPWYAHYDRGRLGDKTVLFRTEPGSYVMVFPVTKSPEKPDAEKP